MRKDWSEENLISIHERAYLYLKDMILEGEFQEGDRLVEREQSMKEHLEIMKAILNKESEMAEYLTKIHIENSKKKQITYLM